MGMGRGVSEMDADTAGEEEDENEVVMAMAEEKEEAEMLNMNAMLNNMNKKQLVKAHRKHIDEFMLLIKEDMQLLKSFDRDEHSIEEYQKRLRDVVDRQQKAVKGYKDKVFKGK